MLGGRRYARFGLLLGAAACSSGATGTCNPVGANGSLGRTSFTYTCDENGSNPSSPGLDAWCATSNDRATIPDVAVGAPFRLAVLADSSGGPQPAVAALAQATAQGWSLAQAGWLGFIAWSGPDVIDFTHVRARAVASLAWQSLPPTRIVVISEPTVLAVVPLDDSGATLGGALGCTFSVSDASVLSVTGTGRVASIFGRGDGDATVTASCAGRELQATVHVHDPGVAPASNADGGGDDAGPDDGGLDTTGDSGADASRDGPPESAPETPADAALLDAGDGT
jgi:hypothetical protein